jgi:hypothetical protein
MYDKDGLATLRGPEALLLPYPGRPSWAIIDRPFRSWYSFVLAEWRLSTL